MAKDYNAINFKNKDIDKFSTRFGNGDPIKGSTGSARETKKNESNVLTTKQNNALNKGIEKQSGNIKYKGVPETKEPKDWREKSRVGALVGGTPYVGGKDKGGKKNMNTGGNKSKVCVDKPGQKKQDEECRNPNAK